MGVYAGVTDNYLTQSDQTKVADSVKKYSIWSIGKEGNPGRRPGIDLNFAENKSLVDDVTNTNLITFTRTSAATYVDSNGVIKTAGVNLILYSEEFTNNYWTKYDCTLTENFSAPDGTNSATKVTRDSTSYGTLFVYKPSGISVVTGETYTISWFIKAGTYTGTIGLDLDSSGTGGYPIPNSEVFFNISNGTYDSGGGTYTITEYSDGWYRYSVTGTATSNGSIEYSIFSNGANAVAIGEYFYIWGAQIEKSSTPSPYAKTTGTASGAPRFDHDPVTGESLGLLIEESRTNLITHSSSFSGITTGTWGSGGTLPTGWVIDQAQQGTNLDIVDYGTENGLDYIDLRFYGNPTYPNRWLVRPGSSVGLTTNVSYHSSCYAKLISGSTSGLSFQFSVRGGPSGAALSGIDSTLKRYDGNWTATTTGTYYPRLDVGLNASSGSYDVTVRFAAPQAEQGAFLTSYIPTSGSTVTRSVDSALLDTSNWWDYTKGTAYAEYRGGLESNQSGYGRVWSPFTVATFIAGQASHVYNNRHTVWFGGTAIQLVGQEHLSSFAKNAITYSNNGTNCDIVNASYPSSTTGTTNSCTDSDFHGIGRNVSATTNILNGHIKRMTYWEQVLNPSTLQSLTE